ncbi:MAG TPA: hypothetical protein VMZ73_09630 [Acidimicrobiales bacterium]|nr:hypothetical protein [Acidimicrobiales bacterium]
MRNARRGVVAGAGTALAVSLMMTAAAWACIAGPTLNVAPATVKPGQEVAVSGFSYNGSLPIVVRFNAFDGPILGTFQPDGGRFGDPESLTGKVTIPAGTKPGSYVLIATQPGADGSLAQVPVRALVTVTADGSAPVVGASVNPPELGRPVGPVVSESSVSTWSLVLIGLGAGGVAMFLAGIANLIASRRREEPRTAPVSH